MALAISPSTFTVFIGPGFDGVYGLSFDATELNIEPRYRLLKHLAVEGGGTYREMGKAIAAAHTSIPNYLDKLIAEGMVKGSQRQMPLVGASLWAAQRIKNNPHHTFAFPRYNTNSSTNANSASAAINKWLKPRVPDGCVIHSFRHSLRDRLRAVQCPSDMIDQIGGWSTAGVGQAYGAGYSLEKKWEWLGRLFTTNAV